MSKSFDRIWTKAPDENLIWEAPNTGVTAQNKNHSRQPETTTVLKGPKISELQVIVQDFVFLSDFFRVES